MLCHYRPCSRRTQLCTVKIRSARIAADPPPGVTGAAELQLLRFRVPSLLWITWGILQLDRDPHREKHAPHLSGGSAPKCVLLQFGESTLVKTCILAANERLSFSIVFLGLFIATATPALAWPQASAAGIAGRVTDASGAAVGEVNISVTNLETGARQIQFGIKLIF